MPSPNSPRSSDEVVTFWRDAGPAAWFRKDDAFDADFRQRFESAHEAAAAGSLTAWEATAEGTLALLILLDQFPRNAYRGSARMFATDRLALAVADKALTQGFDLQVDPSLRNFFYLPFMHSEQLADQDRVVGLTTPLGGEALRFANVHRDIIARFGRFPHRNPLLGRQTSPDEQRFLDEGGFAG
ncbi:MAG: hypothetical protein RLZZ618_2673 [Pseudomonadota bacterium]|jgi:uncharacterized protein (DUF924 family)